MEGFRNFRLKSKAILKTFIVKIVKEQKAFRIFKCKDRRTSITFISILHKVIPSSIQQSFVEGLPCARHSSRYHRYGRCVWISYICKPYILQKEVDDQLMNTYANRITDREGQKKIKPGGRDFQQGDQREGKCSLSRGDFWTELYVIEKGSAMQIWEWGAGRRMLPRKAKDKGLKQK